MISRHRIAAHGDFPARPRPRNALFTLNLGCTSRTDRLRFGPPRRPLIFLGTPGALANSGRASIHPGGVRCVRCRTRLIMIVNGRTHGIDRTSTVSCITNCAIYGSCTVHSCLRGCCHPGLQIGDHSKLAPVLSAVIPGRTVPSPRGLALHAFIGNRLHRRNAATSLVFDIPFLVTCLDRFVALGPNSVVTANAPGNLSSIIPNSRMIIRMRNINHLIGQVIDRRATG